MTSPDRIRTLLEAPGALGQPDRSTRGREVDYWCPFCEKRGFQKTSHIHVNYQKNCAICHQCGGWRDLIVLVRAIYGRVPKSLMQMQVGEDLVDHLRTIMRPRQEEQQAEEKPAELPAEFVPFGSSAPSGGMGRIVWNYLTIDDEHNRGVEASFLEDIGAGYCEEGRYAGYAIFPIYVGGELVTFTSRRVIGTSSKAQHGDASKSRLAVFNYDAVARLKCRRVFIGEGPFDGWAFHRRVDRNDGGVALLGKVLHDEQCRLLDALPHCEELCLCLDDTEHAKTREGAEKLARMTSKRVSYILLKEGTGDPHKNRDVLYWYVDRRKPFDPVMTRLGALLA